MVLMEKIDFSNIKMDQFRQFKCLCELCDCGCFERMKQSHHPECKRQYNKTRMIDRRPFTIDGSKKCAISHYKDTFKSDYQPRPATTYRPPPNEFEYVPKGSIDFNTTQKSEYKAYENAERAAPYKSYDHHEPSTEPISGVSSYKAEYFSKENHGFANRVKKNPNEPTMYVSTEKISGNTTNKDHYVGWSGAFPKREANEYPSYAGDALFPTRERSFHTSTNSVHKALKLPKRGLTITNFEIRGSLKNEGEIDMATNYRDTFVKFKNVERTKKILPNSQGVMVVKDLSKIKPGITQTHSDYVSYPNHHPPRPADCNPFNSDLNKQILYPGEKQDLTTSYATVHVGYDPKENPKPKSFKQENPVYQKPIEKIDSETVTKRDFKPIDLKKIPSLKAIKVKSSINIPNLPMENKTMAMIQFVPYEVKPVVHAKDSCRNYYIPPKTKFQSETTTGSTFTGEKGIRTISLKPDFDNLDLSGKLDLATNYRDTYVNHGLSMCEAKAYLIANSLNSSRLAEDEKKLQKSLTML